MTAEEKIRAVLEAPSLDELRQALIDAEEDADAMRQIAALRLPSFGGQKPRMQGALSYDAERLLVPDPESGELKLISRKEAASLENKARSWTGE